MTDLIDLDAAIAALFERQSNYREETSTWAQIALDILILRALPTIDPTTLTSNSVDDSKTANPVVNDPAAIREAALREAAGVARNYAEMDYCAMGYPEDGGMAASGTAHTIEMDILALIGEKK